VTFLSVNNLPVAKIQTLRAEMLIKLTDKDSNQKYDKEMMTCHDFLMPWFVMKGNKFYYLQKKSNFKEVKVGSLGNQIRFQYVMDTTLPDGWKDAQIEAKPMIFYTFECDSDFKVIGTYEDEHFKGVELAELKLTKNDEIEGFVMY
jgi:hypothetical protein